MTPRVSFSLKAQSKQQEEKLTTRINSKQASSYYHDKMMMTMKTSTLLLALLGVLVSRVTAFQVPLEVTKTPITSTLSPCLLSMSGGAKEESGEGTKKKKKMSMEEKIAGRKKRVKTVYKIVAAETGLFSAVILVKSRNPFYSVGPLLASTVSYILLGAAVHDRLASDTYKRLNLTLFAYGLVALPAGILMKFPPIWTISCLIAMINSVKGYGYGLKGWELGPACAKEDLLNGIKSNLKTIIKLPNLKSAGYLAGTVTLSTLVVTKIMEIVKIIQTGGGSYMLGQRIFRLSMFMILNVIMFTLKDAADRGRLEGTTFIQLNAVTSISFLAFAWESYKKAAFAPLHESACMFFSLLSALNGVSSILKNRKE